MIVAEKFTAHCPSCNDVKVAAFDHTSVLFRMLCSECKHVLKETPKPLTARGLLEALAAPEDE